MMKLSGGKNKVINYRNLIETSSKPHRNLSYSVGANNLLLLEDISLSFEDGRMIFDRFSLSFQSGKTTAILGRSGAGKSTIVRLICGLLLPDSGTIRSAEGGVLGLGQIRGLLFQDDTLIPWLDVLANAIFPRALGDDTSREATAADRLECVGLREAFGLRPSQLSAGMKKRLEFVRATLADDKYLVADEPFTGLDVHQRRILWREWSSWMRGSKRTAIIVTHDLAEVSAVADRVVVITSTYPVRVALDILIDGEGDPVTIQESIIDALLLQPAATKVQL